LCLTRVRGKEKSVFAALVVYFWGPIPWMIEAAALMAFVVGDWGDFAIITSLLLFNALLGFWEEHGSGEDSPGVSSSRGTRANRAEASDVRRIVVATARSVS
jgi:H+-transporting ATPase